jgi:hypothetical protein
MGQLRDQLKFQDQNRDLMRFYKTLLVAKKVIFKADLLSLRFLTDPTAETDETLFMQ